MKYLDVEMTGILVEVPDIRVITVGHSEPGHPVLLAGITSPLRHHTGDDCGRADVKLKPLVY